MSEYTRELAVLRQRLLDVASVRHSNTAAESAKNLALAIEALEHADRLSRERDRLRAEHGPCACGHDICGHNSAPFGCNECNCSGEETSDE